MIGIKSISCLLLVFCLQFPLFSIEKKVGYIDLQFVFENSAIKDTLYKDFLSQKEKVKAAALQAQINLHLIQKSLREKERLLGYQEYLQEYKLIENKIKEHEETIQKSHEDLKQWEQEIMAQLFDEIINILEIIAEEENLSIIISRQTSVVYGETAADITQKAIDLINEINERNTPSAK